MQAEGRSRLTLVRLRLVLPLGDGAGERVDGLGEVLALAGVVVQLALGEERQLHLHQRVRLEVVVQVTGVDRVRNPLLGRLALGWPELSGREGNLPAARGRERLAGIWLVQGKGKTRVARSTGIGIEVQRHLEAERRAFSSGLFATIVGWTARRDAGIRTTAAGCAADGLSASAGVARR